MVGHGTQAVQALGFLCYAGRTCCEQVSQPGQLLEDGPAVAVASVDTARSGLSGPIDRSSRRAREQFDEHLGQLQRRYRAGDAEALLDATNSCLYNDHPTPQWVRAEFYECWERWETRETRSLGEAFSISDRRGHIRSVNQTMTFSMDVFGAFYGAATGGALVWQLQHQG